MRPWVIKLRYCAYYSYYTATIRPFCMSRAGANYLINFANRRLQRSVTLAAMPEHTEAKSCVQCILYSTFLLGAHGYCMAALHSAFARAAPFYDHLAGRTGVDGRREIRGFAPKLRGTIVGRILFFAMTVHCASMLQIVALKTSKR